MSLELNLAGKTAIVTGGSAGIGFATAKALYSEGVSVAIAARNPERLEKAANAIRELPNQGNKVITIAADLTKAESVETVVSKTLEAFGQIDILINNAGSARAGSFLDLGDEAFVDAWNLKLLGYIRLSGICNYFISGTTSGVMEGINNKIKLIMRLGERFFSGR